MSIVRDNSNAMLRPNFRRFTPFEKPSKADNSHNPSIDTPRLEGAIQLKALLRSDEDRIRSEHHDMGLKMARQGMWEQLSDLIQTADDSRLFTPAGENVALLLAKGAGADIIAATTDSVNDGTLPDLEGLADFEQELLEETQDYARALVAAVTRLDISQIWATLAQDSLLPDKAQHAEHHRRRAQDILNHYNALDLDSPSLMATKCRLLAEEEDLSQQLIQDFSSLVKMDPDSITHMRAFGHALGMRLGKNTQILEDQANNIATLTADVWGEGGYTWVYMGALTEDHAALRSLDVKRFILGMKDILQIKPDQHISNEFTAYCAVTADPNSYLIRDLGACQRAICAELNACAQWLFTSHLHELHSILWYQAALMPKTGQNLPGRRYQATLGREIAVKIAAHHLVATTPDPHPFFKPLRNGTR